MSVKPLTGLLLVLLFTAIPIFGHIDQLPINQWDEARLANNALEMYGNGNWIVTHFEGKPDMWNTKPPLMIWLQVISMYLLGFNELAVRFPSIIAALCTCLLLYWFMASRMRKPLPGLLSVLVLITSEGFARGHVIRTGDYDSLLVCFMLAAGIFFFLFLEEEQARIRHLYLFFAALTLAFFTKGIPSLIFIPAMLLYAGWRGKLLPLLKNKHIYIGTFAFLCLAVGYYLLREHYNPGYLKAVLYNDFTGRYLHTDMDNGNDTEYYLHLLVDKLFKFWYLLIIPGIIIGLAQQDDRQRRLSAYAFLLAAFHFVVVSGAKTKNEWYDAPIYPFLSIVVAQLLYVICTVLTRQFPSDGILKKNLLPAAFLILMFTLPYARILAGTIYPPYFSSPPEDESIASYLKDIYHDKAAKPRAALAWNAHNSNVLWYVEILRKTRRPVVIKDVQTLQAEDTVMAYQTAIRDYIDSNYKSSVLETHDALKIYRIDSVKQAL